MSKYIAGLFLLLFGILVHADDSLIYDQNTGNYTLTYNGNSYVFVPGTNISPYVQSWFEAQRDSTVTYRYRVRNGRDAKQSIDDFRLLTSVAISKDTKITSPHSWTPLIVPYLPAVVWGIKDIDNETGSIAPGKSTERFSFAAPYLPEVSRAELWHFAEMPQFQDEGGEEGPDPASAVGQQFNALIANNHVSRYVAAPGIMIPNPFDSAAILTAILHHIDQDLISMKLIEPNFASQLDRLLQAAIDAAKGGNTVALKGDIKDLRRMLKREYPDVDSDHDQSQDDEGKDEDKNKSHQIDKLAARVLDFDLKYIQKRLGHED